MLARGLGCVFTAAAVAAAPVAAAPDPKPIAVDVAGIEDELVLLTDPDGGIYAIRPGAEPRAFYGTAKVLHEQVVIGRSAQGESWRLTIWVPQLGDLRAGAIERRADGTYQRRCDGRDDPVLTAISAERAKAILRRARFLTTALVRRPYLLARDDGGVYYYIDVLAKQYGGKGYRVWSGKPGALRQLPLIDVASDGAGDVFATRGGDLRLVGGRGATGAAATWIRGARRTPLVGLDLDVSSRLIYRDLGIYKLTGIICDSI
jgi:hypothetical protein